MDHRSYQGQWKLSADHCQRLQQFLFWRGQPIYARGQHSLHRWWNLERVERLGDLKRTVASEGALLEQRLHDLFHEKRISLTPLHDKALQPELRPRVEQSVEHFFGRLVVQRIETQLRVVRFVGPLMRILGGAVTHQQDYF